MIKPHNENGELKTKKDNALENTGNMDHISVCETFLIMDINMKALYTSKCFSGWGKTIINDYFYTYGRVKWSLKCF
jgi:hypothetical protein